MGELLHLVQEGTGRAAAPPSPLIAVLPINGQFTNHCIAI